MSPSSDTAPVPVPTPAADRAPATRPALFGWNAVLVLLTVPAWIVVGLLIAAVGSAVVWVGLGLWLVAVGGMRRVAGAYRRVAGRILGTRIAVLYRPTNGGGVFDKLRVVLTDAARWRDVGFAFFAVSLGFGLALSSLIAFLFFPLGYWLSPMLLRLWAQTTRSLIGPTGEEALHRRIGDLEESRSESVDHSAMELRRIERDLHDGAQAQLVALGINLGLAEEIVSRDPAAAAALISDARAASRAALGDLRSLVRGIHPPVLADRGLIGAIDALALTLPQTVEVDVQLPGRPPAPVESAVYFAVAECLANSAKHAAAQNIWVTIRYDDNLLSAMVGDDGVGGARLTEGGGLDGLERRLRAFDGTVTVASPPGGPTIVTLTVPCQIDASPVVQQA